MQSILIAEDSEEDFETIRRIVSRTINVRLIRCRDGEEVLSYLTRPPDGSPGRPSLILLDLNMPGTDGRETLTRLKSDPEWRAIPTVVLSTSTSPKDVSYCYDHGANGYMSKPVNYNDLEHSLRGLVEYWNNIMVLPPAKMLSTRGTTA
jgi:CheY-like chemotaxis protein